MLSPACLYCACEVLWGHCGRSGINAAECHHCWRLNVVMSMSYRILLASQARGICVKRASWPTPGGSICGSCHLKSPPALPKPMGRVRLLQALLARTFRTRRYWHIARQLAKAGIHAAAKVSCRCILEFMVPGDSPCRLGTDRTAVGPFQPDGLT